MRVAMADWASTFGLQNTGRQQTGQHNQSSRKCNAPVEERNSSRYDLRAGRGFLHSLDAMRRCDTDGGVRLLVRSGDFLSARRQLPVGTLQVAFGVRCLLCGIGAAQSKLASTSGFDPQLRPGEDAACFSSGQGVPVFFFLKVLFDFWGRNKTLENRGRLQRRWTTSNRNQTGKSPVLAI